MKYADLRDFLAQLESRGELRRIRVEIDGDRATATSYLQIITPDKDGAPRELSGHGTSSGFRIHRVGANRWELKRTPQGWKVTRRTLRPLDGSDGARDLLGQIFA